MRMEQSGFRPEDEATTGVPTMAGSAISRAWSGWPRSSAEMQPVFCFRFPPLLVTLHWTFAMLIIADLCLGFSGRR